MTAARDDAAVDVGQERSRWIVRLVRVSDDDVGEAKRHVPQDEHHVVAAVQRRPAELMKHSPRADRAKTVGKTRPIGVFMTTVQLELP